MNLEGLEAVWRAYAKAEWLMKRYERINLENNPEVLKELKYASKAIVNAGQLPNGDTARSNLVNSALKHCDNAITTVRIDSIAGLLDNIREILDCHGIEEKDLRLKLPEWDSVKAALCEIKRRWADDGFATNNGNDAIMEADYHKVQTIREKLALVEPSLRELAFVRMNAESKRKQAIMDAKRRLEQKRSDIHIKVEDVASIVSLILTLICAIFGVVGYRMQWIIVCFLGAVSFLFLIFRLPLYIVDRCINKQLMILEQRLTNSLTPPLPHS